MSNNAKRVRKNNITEDETRASVHSSTPATAGGLWVHYVLMPQTAKENKNNMINVNYQTA